MGALGLLVFATGLASMWLVFPWVIGPLGLLRDFGSWAMLCIAAWWCTFQRTPFTAMVRLLAWSLLLAGWANATWGMFQAYQLWAQTSASDVYGFLHQRNQFATLCLLSIGASAWLRVERPGTWSDKPWFRTLVDVGCVVLGAAASLSASRTGLLALGVAAVLAEALAYRFPRSVGPRAFQRSLRTAWLGYGLALLITLVPSWGGTAPSIGIWARKDTQEGLEVCTSRMSLWANVLELIALRPWTGWGWGELDYAHFETLFRSERFCALLSNAHNLPLQLAVEFGIPIATVVCGAAVWTVVHARPWHEQRPDRLFAWTILLALGIHSLLEYPLWYGPFQVTALLALCILWHRAPTTGSAPPSARSLRLLRSTLAALLALLVLVVADYVRASQIYLPAHQRLGGFRTDTRAQIRTSIWFQDMIDFADLGLVETVTAENAVEIHAMATGLLHFSPEAMVVQKLLDSAYLLGLTQEYAHYQQRFAAAYPQAFLAWKVQQTGD